MAKIPKRLEPNPVLVNLFSSSDQKLNEYLAGVLEDCAVNKIIADIEYAYVQSMVRQI